jgi:hypothetical protein
MPLQGTHVECKILNIEDKCFVAPLKMRGSQLKNWKWKVWHAENAGYGCSNLL